MFDGADPGFGGVVNKGAFDVVARCVAETVDGAVAGERGCVVQDVFPAWKGDDVRGPDFRFLLMDPAGDLGHRVFLAAELPHFEVTGVCNRHVYLLAVHRHFGGVGSPAIVCADDRGIREAPATKAWCSSGVGSEGE